MAKRRAARGRAYRWIVVAVDFSPATQATFAEAARLAEQTGARLSVIHVVPRLKPTLPHSEQTRRIVVELQGEANRDAEQKLRALVEGSRVDAVPQVVFGLAHKAVLRHAAQKKADLIVVGKHGGNVAERLLLGSTADRIVRKSAVPVVVVPAPTRAPRQGGRPPVGRRAARRSRA